MYKSINMIESIILSVILGYASGLFAWVFLSVLTEPKGIFDFYKPAVQKYITLREGKKPLLKLDKVLTRCSICMGGQIATWSYFISFSQYSIMAFVLCTCTAILTATILETKIKI